MCVCACVRLCLCASKRTCNAYCFICIRVFFPSSLADNTHRSSEDASTQIRKCRFDTR